LVASADLKLSEFSLQWHRLQSLRKEVANQIFTMYEKQHDLKSVRDKKILKHRLTRRMSPLILELVDEHALMVVTPTSWKQLYPGFKGQLCNGKTYKSTLQAIVIELLKAIADWAQGGCNDIEGEPPVAYGVSLVDKTTLNQNELDKIDLQRAFQYVGKDDQAKDATLPHLVRKLLSQDEGDQDEAQALLEMIETSIARRQEEAKRDRDVKKEMKRKKQSDVDDAATFVSEGSKGVGSTCELRGGAQNRKRKKDRPHCPYVEDQAKADGSGEDDESITEDEEEQKGDFGATQEEEQEHHFQDGENGGLPKTVTEVVLGASDKIGAASLEAFLRQHGDRPVPIGLETILGELAKEHRQLESKLLQEQEGSKRMKNRLADKIQSVHETNRKLQKEICSLKGRKEDTGSNKETQSQIHRLEAALEAEKALRGRQMAEVPEMAKRAREDQNKVLQLDEELAMCKRTIRNNKMEINVFARVASKCKTCKVKVMEGLGIEPSRKKRKE